MIDVSVIVATYNSDWNKLRMTLNSILLQKKIDFQIIIADDGSKTRWDEKIKELFSEFNFNNYIIANMGANGGTVRNLYNALQYVKCSYVKTISPGDFFYENTTLYEWVQFMKDGNYLFSFCDAVYYNNLRASDLSVNNDTSDSLLYTYSSHNTRILDNDSIQINIVQTTASPSHLDLYCHPQNRNKIFTSYMLANDTVLGAAVMAETNIYKKYLKRIVNRLIYAEDYLVRLLIFDGIEIEHFPCIAVWYEYGLGISNSGNEKWTNALHKDFDECNRIITESTMFYDDISKKYYAFLKKSSDNDIVHKIKKCITFPNLITYRLAKKNGYLTPTEINKTFLFEIIK